MKNKTMMMGAIALAATMLASCGNGADSVKKVGILQFGSFTALENAKQGFVDELEKSDLKDKISITVQNPQANGPTNTQMAATLAESSDLVYGIATPSATALKNAVASAGTDIPVLFSAVTNPVAANLVASLDAPGANVTGVSDLGPIAEGLDLITKFGCDNIVSFYTSTENNSVYQVEIAEAWMDEHSITHSRKTITAASEIASAISSLSGEVDAIFIPTDDTIANSMASVKTAIEALDESRSAPIVSFACDSGMVDGVTFAMGIDYYEGGVQAAKQAIKILKGEKTPAELPVETCNKNTISINQTFATAEGLAIPSEILAIEGAKII